MSCRFCFGSENTPEDPLIAPCDCAGTNGLVHAKCIERWVETSESEACNVCKRVFACTDINSGIVPVQWFNVKAIDYTLRMYLTIWVFSVITLVASYYWHMFTCELTYAMIALNYVVHFLLYAAIGFGVGLLREVRINGQTIPLGAWLNQPTLIIIESIQLAIGITQRSYIISVCSGYHMFIICCETAEKIYRRVYVRRIYTDKS